jgi:uncharacterized protein
LDPRSSTAARKHNPCKAAVIQQPMHVYVGAAKHGKGLFAAKSFTEGEAITVFSGPKITYSQVLKLKNPDNALAISPRRYLDFQPPGVYANHSCNPNAGLKPDLTLIAIKPIKKNEEITWDYSTTLDWTVCNFTCACGAKDCRKEITDFAELPKRKQQYYLKKGVVLPFIMRKLRRLARSSN